jgi:hypothetical protein
MSLYHQVYNGEHFSEQHFYEAVQYVLGPESYGYDQEQLENAILDRVDEMGESDAENFWKSLGKVARNVAAGSLKLAAVAAPIAGKIIGGPIGGAIGKAGANLAGMAANAIQAGPQGGQSFFQGFRQRMQGPAQAEIPAAQQYAAGNPTIAQNAGGASGLLLQLLSLINNPQLLGALTQQSLGSVPANQPTEDYSFTEMVESLYSASGNLLKEYYEGGLLDTESYTYDRYGHLVPVDHQRIHQLTESITQY